jgi:ubiquinone/menaquinone biosynthesis C-methylase UbiE
MGNLQDADWGRLPGAEPPLRWWIPAAVAAVVALVLVLVVVLVDRRGPRHQQQPEVTSGGLLGHPDFGQRPQLTRRPDPRGCEGMAKAPRRGHQHREERERVRRIYDKIAGSYDRGIAVAERLLFAGGRAWAGAQATGQVLEVGIGTGRNLEHYGPDVHVTGVDISPQMLARAGARAAALRRVVDLRVGDAEDLQFPDAQFDTIVATLTLCSVPNDRAAVQEMARVLRPGGRTVLLDHVASPHPLVATVQRALDPLFVGAVGDHLLREPDRAVRGAGLTVEHLQRSKLGIVTRLSARKPDRGSA